MGDLHLDRGAAATGAKLHEQRNQNSVVQLQELPGLDGHPVERSPELIEETTNLLLPTVSAGDGILIWRCELEVRARIAERGVPIPPAYLFV
jgi:hypothetical protein